MGVLNQDPNLVDIINKLDDRLRALEQSVRFAAPVSAVVPNNPVDGQLTYVRTGNSTLLGIADSQSGNIVAENSITMNQWYDASPEWYVGANKVTVQNATGTNYQQVRYRVTGRMVNVEVGLFCNSPLSAGQWTFTLPLFTRGVSFGSGFTQPSGGNYQPFIVWGYQNKAYFIPSDINSSGSWAASVAAGQSLAFSLTYEASISF